MNVSYDELLNIIEHNGFSTVKAMQEIKQKYDIPFSESEPYIREMINTLTRKENVFNTPYDPFNKEKINDKIESTKQQYKAYKKAGIVSCPKCGSQSITTTNKKLSASRGAVGALAGSVLSVPGAIVGGAVGGLTSKKIYNVCMNCGHKWKP